MKLDFDTPTPLDFFASLVQSDAEIGLLEAAISLAQDEYPELDVQSVLGEVDQLIARLQRRLSVDAGPLQKLRVLNQFFFQDLKFGGNVNDYYDPENSFIHTLLRTRRGIPISLGVLWMELAQGIKLAVRGVGFPGHFMVKVHLPMGQAVIEPMSGRSLSREELAEMLEPYRTRVDWSGDSEVPLGLYLQSMPYRDILARMLRNLKEIYSSQSDRVRQLAVQERLVILYPESWPEYRDRGLLHLELGHMEAAANDLQCYLVHASNVADAGDIAERLESITRQ
jgi:regulator of sirC expression with transglutaminase-like and TPR domain